MTSQLTEDQDNLVKKIAESEGIGDYELEVNAASEKGDGYLGVISTVNLIGKRSKLNLIMKTAETNEELRKKVVVRKAYLREIYIYNTVLPEFENFQRKLQLQNSFQGFAKIYGSCEEDGKEFLILENLKAAGFKLWNRKIPMNSEHVAAVFSEYGKLHAVSLAMRDKEPEKFNELTKDLVNIFKDAYSPKEFEYAVKMALDKGFKAVKGDGRATEALRRYSDTIKTFLMEELNPSEYSIVVTHADCWCNNMMFKYEDDQNPQKPTRICLLDFQLSHMASPVMDLAYFFFVCSSKEVIYNYESYLKIYHETVSENLKQLSCDPEKIFPYALLEDHWKRYAKFGLYMALMVITLMLSETEEVPVLNEVMKNSDTIFDGFNYEGVHINDYNKRISDIVNFMAEYELI